MVEYFGNRRTTADTSYRVADPATHNQRACIFGPFPVDGWATQMSIWGGKETTSPRVMLAVWNVEDRTTITDRRGYTNAFSPSAVMNDATGGAAVTANLNHMNPDYSPSEVLAMKVNSGDYYALGFLSLNENFPHAVNTDDQKALHRETVAASPPSSPFVAATSATSAELDVWFSYQENRAPDTPTTGLAPSGGISTQTPTITADFTDDDSGYGDVMSKYRIQVREVGTVDSLLLNQTFAASEAEKAANAVSRVYSGSTLTAGVDYEWRIKFYDQHNAESDYSAWTTFEITTGVGTMTTPAGAALEGKQDAVNGFDFEGQWTHTSSLALTHVTVEIRQQGTVTQRKEYDLPNVASSAAPGTYFAVNFDDIGFSDLAFGDSFSWRMKGKDTAGIYSEWSALTSFTTNTTPAVPSGMTPRDSQSISTAPILKMTSDDDDDTPVEEGGLQESYARILHLQHIPNQSFTTDIAGWTASNTGDNAGATAAFTWGNNDISGDGWGLDGYQRIAVTPSTATAGIVYHTDLDAVWIPCVVGEDYDVEGQYWTTTADLQLEIYIKWYNSSRAFLSQSSQSSFTPRTTATNFMRLTATAPASAAYYQIGVRVRGINANQTGTIYFTEVGPDSPSLRVAERQMDWNALTERWNYQTLVGTDDVQTITKTGTVTGGTWSFTFNDAQVTGIAHNASAATVEAAIEALSTIGAGNVSVATHAVGSGGWILTFAEKLAGTYQNIGSVSSSLTGTTPGIGIAHTTNGAETDLGPTGKYWWRGYSTDTVNTSDYSELEAFFYVTGPVVVITSHTDGEVVTNSRPEISWTAANQLRYRVRFYLYDTTTVIHDSGWVTTPTQSYQPPVGTLRNNTDYDLVVSVENTNGIEGANDPIRLEVSMSAPDELAFEANERFIGFDQEASGVTLSWELTDIATELFVSYIVGRRETGDDIDNELILREITNINQKTYIDAFPKSGVDYTYTLRQSARASSTSDTVVESNAAESSVTISFSSVVIASVEYPSSRRAVLHFVKDRSSDHKRNQVELPTWGNRAPVILQDQTNYEKISGIFTVVADTAGTALQYMEALRNLWNNGDTCCFRDDRGRKLFGTITRFKETDEMFSQYAVDLEFTETNFSEGE